MAYLLKKRYQSPVVLYLVSEHRREREKSEYKKFQLKVKDESIKVLHMVNSLVNCKIDFVLNYSEAKRALLKTCGFRVVVNTIFFLSLLFFSFTLFFFLGA